MLHGQGVVVGLLREKHSPVEYVEDRKQYWEESKEKQVLSCRLDFILWIVTELFNTVIFNKIPTLRYS